MVYICLSSLYKPRCGMTLNNRGSSRSRRPHHRPSRLREFVGRWCGGVPSWIRSRGAKGKTIFHIVSPNHWLPNRSKPMLLWTTEIGIQWGFVYIYIHTYIHTYIRMYVRTYIQTYIHTYIPVVPGKRRGGGLEQNKTSIGRRWPIGKFLKRRSNEVLKLWGASVNEQMVAEMPMKGHGTIHAKLTEWIIVPMNLCATEPMNR